jgi:hypothetical protein
MMNKKILATLTAVGMIASMSTMVANAAVTTEAATEATASGTGNVEDIIDMEIVTATLPTSIGTTFDFAVDPQELMEKAGAGSIAASLSLTPASDNTVLFTNSSGYSNKSDELTITAYNSVDADISVKATIGTADSKIKFSSKADFGTAGASGTDDEKAQAALDKEAHLYLAMESNLNAADSATTTVFTKDGLNFKEDSVPALAASNFKVTYTAGSDGAPGTYAYAYDTSKTDKNEFKFNLTGSSNPNADWTDMENEQLKLDFVWSVKKHVDSYISGATSVSAASPTLTLSSGAATVSTVEFAPSGSSTFVALSTGEHYAVSGTTLTFTNAVVMGSNIGATVKITFSDGKTETITVA